LVRKGYRFECEILPDKTISLTAVDPNDEGDVAIELCRRRSAIPKAVRSLVHKAVMSIADSHTNARNHGSEFSSLKKAAIAVGAVT
jgi:hypothetical protein